MVGVGRRRPGEQPHAGHDPSDTQQLAGADALPQCLHTDHQQKQQSSREDGLDNREGCERECQGLERPTEEGEGRTGYPARPREQPTDQRRAKGVSPRNLARLKSLEGGAGVVEHRSREREGDTEHRGHSSPQ
jgi:hypothetical protein